uniref:Xylose isomerase-like TIM barrel domain-containing protein n=1 Tax=viral metagenome TaxID=1070528 RepID=A0A6C0M0N6_9ZZZZ
MELFPLEDDTLRIGYHISVSNSLTNTIRNAMARKITAMQFFLHSPREWARKNVDLNDAVQAGHLLAEFPSLWVCVHASYIYNLHGVIDTTSQKYHTNYELTIRSIATDLDICVALGCGMVLHPGSAKRCDKAFRRMALAIDRSLTEDSSITVALADVMGISCSELKKRRMLHLENCAGEGSKIGTIADLHTLLSLVSKHLLPQVGVCIDTCHLFASKDCNLRNVADTKAFLHDVNLPITVVHLNDSQQRFGSRKDRHESVCSGMIWGSESVGDDELLLYDFEPLMAIVAHCDERSIPMIVETANGAGDVSLVRFLYDREKTNNCVLIVI